MGRKILWLFVAVLAVFGLLIAGYYLLLAIGGEAARLWLVEAWQSTKSILVEHGPLLFLAIAILPGISRSGSTIAISVLLGIDKKKSAEFSFLMVIPLILGKIAKDILSGELEALSTTNFLPFLFGFLAALISGYFACNWMLELVRRSKLSYFAIYCLIVGIIAINS